MSVSLADRYDAEIGRLVEELRRAYQPERILIFGSCAHGDVREDSDIDLLVVKRTSERPVDRRARARLLLRTEFPVDVIVYTLEEFAERAASGEPVFRRILAEARTLYDARAA